MRRRSDRSAASAASRLTDGLLLCCGVAGLVCVAWWALSLGLGLGLVSFATGSMSPRYPTGSIAVTAPVALDRVQVGDVVTVQRGGGLPPITHRVVSVRLAPGGGRAVVALKGDANRVEDPAPYTVTALRKVVLPLPPVADVLRYTASPAAVIGIGAVIAGCLASAFWPERIRPRHRGDVPPRRVVPVPAGRRDA
ncbi:signal peptidase I [Amnibacterium setariae]|uniref:Signal peptidase I n=1 Tax=Amnibacterium setariae TaxID=2306585 RepID=A0A3A1TWX1_9MICO|nr:signal peptidase I [Amnibacterium setariae]RIX28280.1 signal peptidase I [Amnibacterium setariae]